MAKAVTFYNVSEPSNTIPKTIGPSNRQFEANCELKENTSMKNPVFILEYNPLISNSNYFYSHDFQRYYFITNVTFSQQRMFVEGEVDPLQSFASDILDLTCYVARESVQTIGAASESEAQVLPNILLPDNFVPIQVNRAIRETGDGDTGMNNFKEVDSAADKGTWVMLINGGIATGE